MSTASGLICGLAGAFGFVLGVTTDQRLNPSEPERAVTNETSMRDRQLEIFPGGFIKAGLNSIILCRNETAITVEPDHTYDTANFVGLGIVESEVNGVDLSRWEIGEEIK